MAKIWFRVGMEAEISEEELDALQTKSYEEAKKLMREIINKSELSGETYILGQNNGDVYDYDNPDEDISFSF